MKKFISLILSLSMIFTLSITSKAVFFSGSYEILFYTKQSYENTKYEYVFYNHRNLLNKLLYGINGIDHIREYAAFRSVNPQTNPPFYILRAETSAKTREEAQKIADKLISSGISDKATVMDLEEFSVFNSEFTPESFFCEILGVKSSASNFGDIDCTGDVTASDARTALRISVGLENKNDYPYLRGDMDYNGRITASDAREILRVSVGLSGYSELA